MLIRGEEGTLNDSQLEVAVVCLTDSTNILSGGAIILVMSVATTKCAALSVQSSSSSCHSLDLCKIIQTLSIVLKFGVTIGEELLIVGE